MMTRTVATALLAGSAAVFTANLPASAETKPPTSSYPAASCNYTKIYYTRAKSMIVIHDIEGSYWGAISWFQNCNSRVSAHYVIGYNGTIAQMVNDNDIAWHAAYYNSRSIGIEHEGYAYKNYWTDAEYRSSAHLVRYLCQTYAIPKSRSNIVGHVDLGSAGGGHTDPGPYFNWTYYMSLVGSSSTTPPPTPPPSTSTTQARKITSSALNVRSGPGTGYSIIGTVYAGQHYIQHAVSGSWSKIWYAGNAGWVYTPYTTQATGVSAVKCTADTLNVRSGPGTGYSTVGTMRKDQMYFWTQYEGLNGWYKFYFGGSGSRYSSGSYLSRVAM